MHKQAVPQGLLQKEAREYNRVELLSRTYLGQHFRITEDDQSVPSAGEGDIQTPRIVQEADSLMLVGTHAGQDDVVLLASLEGVNRCNLNLLIELRAKGSIPLHVVDQVRSLSFVGSDHTNLRGHNAGLQEMRNNLLANCCLGPTIPLVRIRKEGRKPLPVQVRGTGRRDFLLPHAVVEEHGLIRLRPREINTRLVSLADSDTVLKLSKLYTRSRDSRRGYLKRSLIECVGGEFREAGVHTVLHLQTNRTNTQDHKPFEQ